MPDNQNRLLQAWLATVNVTVGFVLTWLTFIAVTVVAALVIGLSVTVVLLPPLLVGLTTVCRWSTTLQGKRFSEYAGVGLRQAPQERAGTGLRRWVGLTT